MLWESKRERGKGGQAREARRRKERREEERRREKGKDRKKKKKKRLRVSQGGQKFSKYPIAEKRIRFHQHALFPDIFDIPISNLSCTFQWLLSVQFLTCYPLGHCYSLSAVEYLRKCLLFLYKGKCLWACVSVWVYWFPDDKEKEENWIIDLFFLFFNF